MSPSEFYQKLTACLLLCDGWMTSGVRSIENNAYVGGVWNSLNQVGLAMDCVLEDKSLYVPMARRPAKTPGSAIKEQFTYGELFIEMCDRVGLIAKDEATHFHVQPKIP